MDFMDNIKTTLSSEIVNPDVYRVDSVSQEDDRHVGTVATDRLTDILIQYSDACCAFELTTGAGYQKIPEQSASTSFGKQTDRVEKSLEAVLDTLTEYYDCQIRLDTVDPQVAIITNERTEIHIEIDTSAILWAPPEEHSSV